MQAIQTAKQKKIHMSIPEPKMPEVLIEHTQKMIKPDYIQDRHIPKSDERWCLQCRMMWFLVDSHGTKNFKGKSEICLRCRKQNKCNHERHFKTREMLECVNCKLRWELNEVEV